MKKTFTTFCGFLCLMGLYIPTIHAQYPFMNQWAIAPYIGYHSFDTDRHTENNLTIGGKLDYAFARHWIVEGDLGFTPSQTTTERSSDDVRADLNLLYLLQDINGFYPFIGLGGSIDTLTDTTYGLNGIVGVLKPLTERFAIRLEGNVALFPDEKFVDNTIKFGVHFMLGEIYKEPEPEPKPVPKPKKVIKKPAPPKPKGAIVNKKGVIEAVKIDVLFRKIGRAHV